MADEIHYLTYDPDAIFDEMQDAYVAAGGDPLYPGDEKYMLLRSVQADIVQVFAGVDNALRMQTLRYAVRDYLDVLGESRGCERMQARAATGHVQFTYTNPSAQNESFRTIKAGTLLTADGIVSFALDNDVSLITGSTKAVGTLSCTNTGNAGNGLAAGQKLTFVNLTNPLITDIQIVYEGTTGGRDTETDDDYRERIRMFMSSPLSIGTKEQYERAVIECDSRIEQACARLVDNVVTIDIVSSGDESVVALAAKNALISGGQTALGCSVHVQPATKKNYTIELTITKGTATQSDINAVIASYTSWQNNVLGRNFCPERLVGMLYAAGCVGVVIGLNSKFDNATVQFTQIEGYQRCSGTVTWT